LLLRLRSVLRTKPNDPGHAKTVDIISIIGEGYRQRTEKKSVDWKRKVDLRLSRTIPAPFLSFHNMRANKQTGERA
jgi:hypothetical protein